MAMFFNKGKKKEEETKPVSSFGNSNKQSAKKVITSQEVTPKSNDTIKRSAGTDKISKGKTTYSSPDYRIGRSKQDTIPSSARAAGVVNVAKQFLNTSNQAYVKGTLDQNTWVKGYNAITQKMKSEMNDQNKAQFQAIQNVMNMQGRNFFKTQEIPAFPRQTGSVNVGGKEYRMYDTKPMTFSRTTPEGLRSTIGQNNTDYLRDPSNLTNPSAWQMNPNTPWGKLSQEARNRVANEGKMVNSAYAVANGASMNGLTDNEVQYYQNAWKKIGEDYAGKADEWRRNHPEANTYAPDQLRQTQNKPNLDTLGLNSDEKREFSKIRGEKDQREYLEIIGLSPNTIDEFFANYVPEEEQTPPQQSKMPELWANSGVFQNAVDASNSQMKRRAFQEQFADIPQRETPQFQKNKDYRFEAVPRDLSQLEAISPSVLVDAGRIPQEDYDAIRHRAINGDPVAIRYLTNVKEAGALDMEYSEDPFVEQYMTQEEKDRYNYLWNTGQRERAKEWVDGLNTDLWARAWYAADEATRARLESMPGWALALNNGVMPLVGLLENQASGVLALEDILSGRGINPWRGSNVANTTNEVTEQRIRNWALNSGLGQTGADAASAVYQAYWAGSQSGLTAIGGMATAGAMGFLGEAAKVPAEWFTLINMGTGAGAQTLQNELQMGIPQDRALVDAGATAVIEILTEKIGLDNLFNGNWGGAGMLPTLGKQMGAESAEELLGGVLSDSFGMAYDAITNTNYAELNRAANQYMLENNIPASQREQVMGKILSDRLGEYAMDGFVGGLSSLFGSSPIGTMKAFNNANTIAKGITPAHTQDVINFALTNTPTDSKAFKKAAELQAQISRGIVSARDLADIAKTTQRVARNVIYEVQSIEDNAEREDTYNRMLDAFGIRYYLAPDASRISSQESEDTISAVNASSWKIQQQKDKDTVSSIQAKAAEAGATAEQIRGIGTFVSNDISIDVSEIPGVSAEDVETLIDISERKTVADALEDIRTTPHEISKAIKNAQYATDASWKIQQQKDEDTIAGLKTRLSEAGATADQLDLIDTFVGNDSGVKIDDIPGITSDDIETLLDIGDRATMEEAWEEAHSHTSTGYQGEKVGPTQKIPSAEVSQEARSFSQTLTPEAQRTYTQTLSEARQVGMPETEATRAFMEIYNAGVNQTNYAPTMAVRSLPEWTRNAIYHTGYQESTHETQKLEQRGFAKVTGKEAGVVSTPIVSQAIRDGKLSQKTVDTMNRFAKALGTRVNIVPTADYNGEYVNTSANITVALDSWFLGENASEDKAVLGTFGHELTHRMQDISPKIYNQFAQGVVQAMGSGNFAAKVNRTMNTARKHGIQMSNIDAQAEVIADFVGQTMFTDPESANRLLDGIKAETAEDRAKIHGIRDFIRKAIDWIRGNKDAFKEPEKLISNMQRLEQSLSKLIEESEKAVDNSPDLMSAGEHTETPQTPNQEVQYSLRHKDEIYDRAAAYNLEHGAVSDDTMKAAKKVLDKVHTLMTDPKVQELIPEENILSGVDMDENGNKATTVYGNESYGYSSENSTVCPRSLAMENLLDLVSRELGHPLTVEESMAVSQLAWEYTENPTCQYCYVFADRLAQREARGKYLEMRDKVLNTVGKVTGDIVTTDILTTESTKKDGTVTTDKFVLSTAIKAHPEFESQLRAYKDFLKSRKNTENQKKRFIQWLTLAKTGANMITEEMAATDGTMAEAVLADPSLREQMKDLYDYSIKASHAKLKVGYVAYNNDILELSDPVIRTMNENYGIRFYSYSDYHPAFLLENMQMFMDAATRGLKGLAYTKDLDYVKVFAGTGCNINISIKAIDGTTEMDAMQGADWEGAKELRAKHNNVGIILVATSDAQVEWALAQDWIDVVIPYHVVFSDRVGKIFGWKNYKAMQADKKIKGQWDENANVASITPPMHQNNLDLYLQKCDEYHLLPRFGKWRENPNYMKLVNETRQAEGETGFLQPIFDLEAAEASIAKLVKDGGYDNPYASQKMETIRDLAEEAADKIRGVDKKTLKKIAKGEVKLSMRDQEYMDAVNRGDMDAAQRMVDEAALDAGYTIKVYHGTANAGRFYIFDPKKLSNSKLRSHIGQGFYFTNSKQGAQEYTRNMDAYGNTSRGINPYLFEGYLRLQNPIEVSYNSHVLTYTQVRNIISDGDKAWFFDSGIAQDLQNIEINGNTYTKNEIKAMDREQRIDLYVQYIIRGGDQAALNHMVDAYKFDTQDKLLEAMKKYTGHDGIHWKMRDDLDQFVAFDSSQFKESAPVTYDDDGNVIPLSERFNTENADIRYSLREENPDNDYAQIIERNEQNERMSIVLDPASQWRKAITALDTRKLTAGTDAILNKFGDALNPKQRKAINEKVRKLANDIIRNPKMQYGDISDRAVDIASDIVFQSTNVQDEEGRKAMEGSREAADAVDYLTNLILANIVTTQSKETSKAAREVQRQIERNEKLKETLADVRAKRDAKLREDIEHRKEMRQKKAESKERKYLLDVMNRLNRLAKKSTADQRKEIMDIIGEFNLTCQRLTDGRVQKLEELKRWVNQRMQEDQQGFNPNPKVLQAIEELNQTYIENLSIAEVRDITRALQNIEHEIRTGKHLLGVEESREVNALGREVIEGVKDSRREAVKHTKGIDGLYNEMARPETFFLRLIGFVKSNPLYQLTFGKERSLDTGFRDMIDYKRRANEKFFRRYLDDKAFQRSIIGKNARAVEIKGRNENGDIITLKVTPDLLMAIYMHGRNEQNLKHFVDMENRTKVNDEWVTEEQKAGGMTIPDFELYRKGKIEEAYRKGTKITMSRAEVRHITSLLTAEEMGYIHAAQRYYKDMSQPEINAVSEELNGYSVAVVDNYFRINTDSKYRKADMETVKFDAQIESQGWTKERQNASNPILLMGLTDQLTRDIDGHAKYVGLAIPIRNFNKVYGVTQNIYENGELKTAYASSVQKEIDRMYGKGANDYIEKLMADLQMPHITTDFFGKLLSKVRSHYAGAVLTLNAGVAIKQAASYPTAAAEIGWMPLVKAMANSSLIKGNRLNMDLVYRYSPLMRLRTEGMFTQETGEMKEQGRSIPKALNWIQGMDVATVKKLWKASEYYVRSTYKGLQIGTDEYYKKVGEVHSQVIEKTQPNYSTLHRPQLLRTSNELVKTLNMFKTQPFQNLNILMESIGAVKALQRQVKNNPTAENRAELKRAYRRMGWAITSQAVSALVFALMQFAWDFLRKKDDGYRDEEGELQFETAAKKLAINMGSSVSGMIPFGSVIFEAMQVATDKIAKEINPDAEPIFDAVFYGIDAGTATDSINDSLKGLVNLLANGVSLVGDLANAAKDPEYPIDWESYGRDAANDLSEVLMFAGIPSENVTKMVAAIAEWTLDKGAGMGPNQAKYWLERIQNGITSSNKKSLVANLANTKDPKQFEDLYNTMIKEPGFASSTQTSQEYIDKTLSDMEKAQYSTQYGGTAGAYENLLELSRTDPAAYEAEYNAMLESGFSESSIKAGVEKQMKQEAGVSSVNDLDERFQNPLSSRQSTDLTNTLHESSYYQSADAETQSIMDSFTTDLIMKGSAAWERGRQGIDAGAFDQAEYLAFMAELEKADRAGEGAVGSYSKDEQVAAIDAMGWSDSQAMELWQYLPKGDTKNPYEPEEKSSKKKKRPGHKTSSRPILGAFTGTTIDKPISEIGTRTVQTSPGEVGTWFGNRPQSTPTRETGNLFGQKSRIRERQKSEHVDTPESSWIRGIDYDPETGTLKVHTSRGTYTHEGISKAMYEDFKNAKSKGRWYNAHF